MGRDFRSSLGAGLDSGLSALGVGFDSGFDFGFSGFDFTCDSSPVLAPSTGRRSRGGLEDRWTGIEEKGSLEAFDFHKK
jgi:hypothetical protein